MNTLVLRKGARISDTYCQFFICENSRYRYSYFASRWEDMKKECSLQLISGHTPHMSIVLCCQQTCFAFNQAKMT